MKVCQGGSPVCCFLGPCDPFVGICHDRNLESHCGAGRGRRSAGGLALLSTLPDGIDLDGYHLFHAIRADLLRRLGRSDEAALAYAAALARTDNAREREFLQRCRRTL